jgi:hypothetical protein
LALEDQQRMRTHHSRIAWLGFWNAFCGVAGLLFTAFVGLVATNVSPVGLVLWLLFWLARSLAGIGMVKSARWGRWLGVPVHLLLLLSGVASVVGGFGLWVLLSENGGRAFAPGEELPSLAPEHNAGLVILLTAAVLVNWAIPLWLLIFVLGPMV